MITSIHIQGLRGIREGRFEDLPPLGVLIGPNGCGKSTVLEALFLATAQDVGDAVGRCVQRRMEIPHGSRFLFSSPHVGATSSASLQAQIGTSSPIRTELTWNSQIKQAELGWSSRIHSKIVWERQERHFSTSFRADNSYETEERISNFAAWHFVRFLDQRIGSSRSSLQKVLSYARSRGAKNLAEDLIRELVPDLEAIEILTPDDEPVVHLSFADRSIPVALSGDGMESVVRLALELSSPQRGTFLIEEPESHQHIAAMARSAKVIAAAVRGGSQLVLSTHSLEFLDLLIDELGEDHTQNLGVYQLELRAGSLSTTRYSGEEVRFARAKIGQDLR